MDPVTYELAGGVATITLDDGKANAVSPALLAGLGAALDRAEADGAAVVLAGRPGRFSAGFDLRVLGGMGPEAVALSRDGFLAARRLLAFPRPVVAACTGHAYAMGAFLLLAADLRLGVADGTYAVTANEVAIGITMPRAAIELCRLRLAPTHVERAVVLAQGWDHAGAVAAGFLDELVPEADVVAGARRRAEQLLLLDQGALAATKARSRAEALARIDVAIEADEAELRALLAAA